MHTSVIRHRVADFLKRFPPFDALPELDLLDLAASGRVKFHESEEYVFRAGDPGLPMIWMIQQGRVELLEDASGTEVLCDVLGEGDLLALECLVGDRSCLNSARTASDVILYGIAVAHMERLVARHQGVKRFLSAHFSVSSDHSIGRASWLDAAPPPADFLRARLAALPVDATREQVAATLRASNNGVAALVDEASLPAAILTPLDLCTDSVGPTPLPPTLASGATTRAAVREMLRSRSSSVAITEDGTPNSRLEAILTASDLATFCGYDPVGLIASIRRAGSPAEIVPLVLQARRMVLDGLARPQDVHDCCRIQIEAAEALTEACFRLAWQNIAEAGLDPPRVPCCWLSFGGFARGDQLDPALPMVAAVYDDGADAFRSEDSIYFAAMTGEVMAWLHACGLAAAGQAWPEGAQQSMPLSEWARLYRKIIRNPVRHGLYACREFFDQRMLFGDPSILRRLQEGIALELRHDATAISLLANDTMTHLPPLTFFRGLVLESNGAERDSFDIARTVVSPIADAARVYALARLRLDSANTFDRLETAALDFGEAAGVLREAAGAFRVALYYQATASSCIQPADLGKFDQRILKTAFASIHRFLEFTAARFIAEV